MPRDALEVVPTQVARDVLLGERKVSLTLLIPVEARQVAHPAARRRARPLRKSLLLEREKEIGGGADAAKPTSCAGRDPSQIGASGYFP